jgi:hypothetical protein
MIIETPVVIAVVVPPRENLLNSLPEVDVLMLADPSRVMHDRIFKKDFSRVGVFNPAGQIGMHHGEPPFAERARPLTRRGMVLGHSLTSC